MKALQEWEVLRLVDTAVLVGIRRTEFISGMLREFIVCTQFCGRGWGWGMRGERRISYCFKK